MKKTIGTLVLIYGGLMVGVTVWNKKKRNERIKLEQQEQRKEFEEMLKEAEKELDFELATEKEIAASIEA